MPNYHRWVDRMQVVERKIRPSSVYLFFLVLVAFFAGVLTWEIWSSQHQVVQVNTDGREVEISQALTEQAEVLAARNLELSLEREANQNMQAMFLEQHQKQKELDRELAFYRSIMAPEHQADGVAIHGAEMSAGLLPQQYRVKLVLTQLQKRKQGLKGRAELNFVGLQGGKVVSLPLSSLTEDKFNFSFRYFQVLETVVTFPEDFEFSRLEAKVIVPASRWSKGATAEQSFTAQELLPKPEILDRELSSEAMQVLQFGSAAMAETQAEVDANSSQNSQQPRLLLEQNGQVSDNSAQQTDVRGSND
ncbi:hypothetical protein TUM3794_22050 [Shewanella colwelliana]|uniref:MSHA biogenesis protein MshJ n=1 Tax=Shewanella colwelliana TaxID=23 RepID=A0ABQ4P2H1_SHECO|nr:DUF6776 family protein [Shewanella colwelliana]GIU41351.1 hypothetical protein TUM3794_22050 [Shewanella colwelliana]